MGKNTYNTIMAWRSQPYSTQLPKPLAGNPQQCSKTSSIPIFDEVYLLLRFSIYWKKLHALPSVDVFSTPKIDKSMHGGSNFTYIRKQQKIVIRSWPKSSVMFWTWQLHYPFYTTCLRANKLSRTKIYSVLSRKRFVYLATLPMRCPHYGVQKFCMLSIQLRHL